MVKEQRESSNKESNKKSDNDTSTSWKKKFKRAIKTQKGLSHVMYVLTDEENANAALVSSLAVQLPPAPAPVPPPAPTAPVNPSSVAVGTIAAAFPALSTKVKLNSILKKKGN